MNDILSIRNLNKGFDGITALSGLSLDLYRGEILGLVGPNGAGKTTLFNIIGGFIRPDSGYVILKKQDISGYQPYMISKLGIGRTFQRLRLIRQISVIDNVLLFYQHQSGEKLHNVFFRRGKIRKQENSNREEAVRLLEEIGLIHKANDLAEELSYGQQKLLSLACSLAMKPEIMLLDEPVAGIAYNMTERILEIIRGLPAKGKTVALIEHNLDAVMQVCDRVIFMDAGAKVSEGSPDEVRNDPRVIEAYID